MEESEVEQIQTGKKKKHHPFRVIFMILLLIIFIGLVGVWMQFGEILQAANSVEKLEDGLYTVTFKGDYGFDQFIEEGGAASDTDMANYIVKFLSKGYYQNSDTDITTGDFGCSTLTAQNAEGTGIVYGRNYDWDDCEAIVVHTIPKNGYESYSTCCLEFLGFGDDYDPTSSIMNQMMALGSIYVPLDGMNEKGLCIADLMAGDQEETHQTTEKRDLTTVSAIRLLLDHAATVDEAIAMLKQFDMNSSIGTAHHFSIADNTGKSVVVEYIDNEMVVTETKILANHYLAEAKSGVGSEDSHKRFDALTVLNQDCEGKMTPNDMQSCMETVWQGTLTNDYENTQWTLVCVPEEKSVYFSFQEQAAHYYQFKFN